MSAHPVVGVSRALQGRSARPVGALAVVAALAILMASAVPARSQQLFDPDLPGTDPKVRGSKQYQRWRFDFERHGRKHPYEASHARAEALAVLEAERGRHADGLVTWEPLGPAPILGFPAASGRVSAIAVDPSNASHWLIGAAQGGIWETLDGGATWVPRTDDEASLATGAIAFAPGSPNVVYAGTGEAHFSLDSYGGAGLLKSTDGGTTWTLMAQDTFRGLAFSDIRVDGANANVATAAVAYGIAGRYGSYPPNLPPWGLFRTTDGGLNWSVTLTYTAATDLEVMPGNFQAQYAGARWLKNNAGHGGLLRSLDGGQSWTEVAGPWLPAQVGRVEVAVAPSAPNRVFVAIDNNQASGLLGIWVTDNAWDSSPTWHPVPAPPCPAYQYWYDFETSVDPQDPQRFYIGGVGLCRLDGATWNVVGTSIHVDQHAMAWAGSRMIVGNDGGVYSSTDGGTLWTNHNTNLSLTQFYDGVLHPTDPAFALAGAQDNGSQKWTGGPGWPQIYGADGGDCEISASHPDQHWVVTTQILGIYRTLDGNNFAYAGYGLSGYVPFIARLAKCPSNDDVFIAGTNPLYRTSNFFGAANPTWTQNAPAFASVVYSLEFAPSDASCGTYLAGTDRPELMLTTDAGGTWRNIHVASSLPLSKIPLDLAFDPTDANVAYVALSGFDSSPDLPGHLFKTEDALSPTPSWTSIGPPLNVPHNTVVVDPSRPGVVYVGTDLGVWRSTDAGSSWVPLQGLPNVAVFDLQANATTGSLVAFTHGRGAWRLSLDSVGPGSVGFTAPGSAAGEASGAAVVAVRVERSDGAPLSQPVTVSYATHAGTALAGVDFVATNGTLTFPAGTPSGTVSSVVVPLVDDPTDEPDEGFTIRLSSSSGAVLGPVMAHAVTITDDDAPAATSAADTGVVEGSSGSSQALFLVSLSVASGFPVSVDYATADGSATAGVDYTAGSGVVSFPPGALEQIVPVAVAPDRLAEADETFALQLSAPVNATIADPTGLATILDDDGPSLSSRALLRGSLVTDDLAAAAGPAPSADLFHLAQAPHASYEVVVDAASGDVQPLGLERTAADGQTVLQSAAAPGTGGAWTLRWENSLAAPVDVQYVRIRSGGCASDCGADDRYRVRMFETTLAGPRFNNAGGQASVLILQNTTSAPVVGRQYFWSDGGVMLLSRPFNLGPRATQALALSGLIGLAGVTGSLTVTHDGPYGGLAGKVVSIDSASGLSFDTPLGVRR